MKNLVNYDSNSDPEENPTNKMKNLFDYDSTSDREENPKNEMKKLDYYPTFHPEENPSLVPPNKKRKDTADCISLPWKKIKMEPSYFDLENTTKKVQSREDDPKIEKKKDEEEKQPHISSMLY